MIKLIADNLKAVYFILVIILFGIAGVLAQLGVIS